jgi:hypothetical protein
MRITTLLVTICAVAVSAHAQYVREIFNLSEVVIVGEVLRASDGYEGFTWRRDRPQDPHEPVPVCVLRLRVLSVFKGQVGSEIDVALPKGITYDTAIPTVGTQRYDVRPGQKAIWFLQEYATGEFHMERYSDQYHGYMWTAPGQRYSVTEWNGQIGGNIPVTITQHDTSLRPLLRIADILAANAWAATNIEEKATYIAHLEDMTPLEEKTLGYGKNLEGAELAAYKSWLDNRLQIRFPAVSPKDRMITAAIKMCWGRASAETEFVNLFLSLPDNSLLGRFPTIYTMDATVRLLPKLPTDVARTTFRGLGREASRKIEITRVGIQRFGEHHYLDAAILECLAALWNRPDLNPIVGGTVQEDLHDKIERARQLLG